MSIDPDSSTISSVTGGEDYAGDESRPPCSVVVGAPTMSGTSSASNIPSSPSSPPSEPAYRLHFSCNDIGRYRRSSKRQINWQFGFADLSAVRQGKIGVDCRGEEQEVILLWSLKSGKTRVFWNKRDISHLFRHARRSDVVEFNWESRNGKKFEIVAHAHRVWNRPQYDLRVEGTSFFSLPDLAEVGVTRQYIDVSDPSPAEPSESVEIEACMSTFSFGRRQSVESSTPVVDKAENEGDEIETDIPSFHDPALMPMPGPEETPSPVTPEARSSVSEPDEFYFRKVLAALDGPSEERDPFDIDDELHSDMHSCSHEALRQRVTTCLPGTEEMVSRAIIKAFSEDHRSDSSSDSLSCESFSPPAAQIESDVLCETDDWVGLNVAYAPRPDVDDQKQMYMQKQLDSMFMHVRNERMTADFAARILVNVAIYLDMTIAVALPKDTLVIRGLSRNVESDDLVEAFSRFGEVKHAAVTKLQSFGVCRFAEEADASRACSAASKGEFTIDGSLPNISFPAGPSRRERQEPKRCRHPISPQMIAKPGIAKRQFSGHQRRNMHVDALMGSISPESGILPELSLELNPAAVSPETGRTTLRRNVFTNIPARAVPPVFDAAFPDTHRFPIVSPENADRQRPSFVSYDA